MNSATRCGIPCQRRLQYSSPLANSPEIDSCRRAVQMVRQMVLVAGSPAAALEQLLLLSSVGRIARRAAARDGQNFGRRAIHALRQRRALSSGTGAIVSRASEL